MSSVTVSAPKGRCNYCFGLHRVRDPLDPEVWTDCPACKVREEAARPGPFDVWAVWESPAALSAEFVGSGPTYADALSLARRWRDERREKVCRGELPAGYFLGCTLRVGRGDLPENDVLAVDGLLLDEVPAHVPVAA